jgi:phosphatidylglycerol:prolipoprotein diacylglycerol transferase
MAMILWCRKYQKTWFETLDFIAPCVPTGLMFGRIGNFIGGELYGRAVQDPNYPFGMIFPTDPCIWFVIHRKFIKPSVKV